MLDDANLIGRPNIQFGLNMAEKQFNQLDLRMIILNQEHDKRPIKNVVFITGDDDIGVGLMLETWLAPELAIPFQVLRPGDLPNYINQNSLVIVSDYSGHNNGVVDVLAQAVAKGSQIGVISAGGELIDSAIIHQIAYVPLPSNIHLQMSTICTLRALIMLLNNFDLIDDRIEQLVDLKGWLQAESASWVADILSVDNYAKQLALKSVGKTAVFYSGPVGCSIARDWQTRWGNNAKNVAFSSELSASGLAMVNSWMSLPVEKPFVIFTFISNFDSPETLNFIEKSNQILSGRRPKSIDIKLKGNSLIGQLLWGFALADFVSIYLAALNNVKPADYRFNDSMGSLRDALRAG